MFKNYFEVIEYALPLLNPNPPKEDQLRYKFLANYLFSSANKDSSYRLEELMDSPKEILCLRRRLAQNMLSMKEMQTLSLIALKLQSFSAEELFKYLELVNYIVENVTSLLDRWGFFIRDSILENMAIKSVVNYQLVFMDCLPKQYKELSLENGREVVDQWLNSKEVTHYLTYYSNHCRGIRVDRDSLLTDHLFFNVTYSQSSKVRDKLLTGLKLKNLITTNPSVTINSIELGGMPLLVNNGNGLIFEFNPFLIRKHNV